MNRPKQYPSGQPLRIAVLGAGGIGSAFAFQLATVGAHDVTVIARPGSPRLAHLRHHGGLAKVNGEHASVAVAEVLTEQTPYDVVIVTLQAHRLEDVLPALAASTAKTILFVVNNFHPEHLQQRLGHERCVFGMPFIQGSIDANGKLDANIGTLGPKTLLGRQDLVALFNDAGIPAAFEAKMPLWLKCHVPLCIGFESVAAAGVKRGSGASWGEAMTLATGMHDSFALIKRLGYPLYPGAKVALDRSPAAVVAAVLWSMSRIKSFRTLLAGGADEARALVAVLVVAATSITPAHRVDRIEAMAPGE